MNKKIRLQQSTNDCHSRFLGNRRLFPFTISAGQQANSFCRSADFALGQILSLPIKTLPSQFPSDRLSSTSLDYRRLQRRFRPGFAPGSLVHPCGLVCAPQGHKKNVFGFWVLSIRWMLCLTEIAAIRFSKKAQPYKGSASVVRSAQPECWYLLKS